MWVKNYSYGLNVTTYTSDNYGSALAKVHMPHAN